MTLAEAEKIISEGLLSIYDDGEAKNLATYCIREICGVSKPLQKLKRHDSLRTEDEVFLLKVLDELKTGKPVQYIFGEADFFGLKFMVNPTVLIPRPETEELVEWVLSAFRSQLSAPSTKHQAQSPRFRVLDIGTGSGCIPIVLKQNLPVAEVFGLDVSEDALKTARENAILNRVDVKFIHADVLDEKFRDENDLNSLFDIIISNPPYITKAEMTSMHANVLRNEPHLALFVPDDDPLIFYRKIADYSLEHLTKNGRLYFEINEGYNDQVKELLFSTGFKNIELKQDMNGKWRMASARNFIS